MPAFRCEYRLTHEDDSAFSHEVDQRCQAATGGRTTAGNLAYACMVCNRFKGTNIGSVDSAGSVVRLYRPRSDRWQEHFRLRGAVIAPLSEAAIATAKLLRLNDVERFKVWADIQRVDGNQLTNEG